LSHVKAAHLLAVVVTTVGDGRGPWRAVLVLPVAALDVILGNVSGDIGRRILITARAHFPSRMCRAVHDRLIVGGVLAGDAARLFERASKGVSLFASSWALLKVTGQRAWVP
jgi:hypothetical protein